ncbi:MAG: SUMF1/EgtB/PvdO family nonheme iron enzyme [Verrucomicrobiota bacterium]|nr:SUMF1/EgtB/PvdO family nonheme iron enzyme [Verrucomicrobiota bacterium]
MTLIRNSLSVGLLVAANAHAAITLSNLSAAQREGSRLVDIHYDAYNSEGTTLSISVVVSNGTAQALSGAIGNSVAEGSNRLAIWDGEADLANDLYTNLAITVQASEPAPPGMVSIPAGTNAGTDPDFGSYNLAVDAFLMDATEVTKAEWDTVANSTTLINASDGSGKANSHPVQYVTWYEAATWCNARSAQDGLNPCYNLVNWSCDFNANGYRLPTSDEWEYAARGGLSSLCYPWGNDIAQSNANYQTSSGTYHPNYFDMVRPYTSPAGSFEPNGFGLYDMAGNILEWCNTVDGSGRVVRGGSWDLDEDFARCGQSNWSTSDTFNNQLGFRTVRNAPDPETQTETIVFDSRDYQLAVSSAHGSPVPMVGTSDHPWKAAVTCSVDSVINEGGTNHTCIGWTGTGSVPISGTSNSVVVLLNDLASSIEWNWATDDTDSDGMPDDWELAHFLGLGQAATNDFDFDGQDNLSEYIAGTIPTNPASLFRLSEESIPGGFVLEWPTATNRTYNVYWTPNLVYIGFQPLETNIAFPRNSATGAPATAQGFFRVDVRK